MLLRAFQILVPLGVFTACVEVPVERLCAKFDWTPEAKTIRMDLVAQNVGAGFFSCQESEEECVESIVSASQSGNAIDIDLEGCIERTEQFEQRGTALDIRHVCLLPVDHPTLLDLGIHIERSGRVGKEKEHLVLYDIPDVEWVNLPKSTERRIINELAEENTVIHQGSYSLKANVRSVAGEVNVQDSVTPLFQTHPNLAKTLQDKGVLHLVSP